MSKRDKYSLPTGNQTRAAPFGAAFYLFAILTCGLACDLQATSFADGRGDPNAMQQPAADPSASTPVPDNTGNAGSDNQAGGAAYRDTKQDTQQTQGDQSGGAKEQGPDNVDGSQDVPPQDDPAPPR
jgi:hypothetical protein